MKQQQLRSSVNGQAPLPADLADGELALNYNDNSPAIYLKDSAGAVRKIAGDGAVGTATDLGNTPAASSVEVSSSTGANTTLPAATTALAGVMVAADKTKLDGIAAGAEVNVQSDWTQATSSADDFIKNKPTIPAAASDGAINIDAGTGLSASGSNATANQSGDTTRTLSLNAALNDLNNCTVPSPTNGEFLSWDGTAWVNAAAPSGTTNLGNTPAASTVEVSSSSGTNTTLPAATTSLAGVQTAADKTKLDGISVGAEVNVQSDWSQTTSGADDFIKNKPTVPAAANNGQINVDAGTGLSASGSNATADQSGNTTRTLSLDAALNDLSDCTVPSPTNGQFLSWNGTAWVNVAAPSGGTTDLGNVASTNSVVVTSSSGTNTTLQAATTSLAGVQTAADKTKLNGIESGAEANVQSDWNQNTSSADDFIKNKPTIPAAPGNGQINVNAGTGLSASGTNASANQSVSTTRTLSLNAELNDLTDCNASPSAGDVLLWNGSRWSEGTELDGGTY